MTCQSYPNVNLKKAFSRDALEDFSIPFPCSIPMRIYLN
jgi:hypothetical protein